MPRVIWKGAVSFGLVHIPVVLRAGARTTKLDFDWLDKRDMAPVGYQRINKRTGKPIESENIVKGYQYQKGEYVLMSDEDFRAANVEATQTVDIHAFVDVSQIPTTYFDTPYYLEPDRRGDKGYALLRETLRRSGRAALATVVIHTKQHLAAVLVQGDALVLNTMRFADEVLSEKELALPADDLDELGVGKRELEMASRLVEDMTEDWKPEKYVDTYREDLLDRIDDKVKAGKTHQLTPAGEATRGGERGGAQIIDLVEMLRRSIDERGGKAATKEDGSARGKSRRAAARDETSSDDAEQEETPAQPKRRSKSSSSSATKRPAAASKAAPRKSAASSERSSARRSSKAASEEKPAPRRKRA